MYVCLCVGVWVGVCGVRGGCGCGCGCGCVPELCVLPATRSWSQGFGDGSAPLWDAVLTAACGPQLRALDIVTHSDSIGGEEAGGVSHSPSLCAYDVVFFFCRADV